MNSSWRREIMAVFRKEVRTELRSRSGLVTGGLFGLCAVVTLSVASFNSKVNGDLAAGLLWVAILFASVLALPRTFLLEEEQGTADLLRLFARPHAVFWGKALFNVLQTFVMALILTFLFILFSRREVGLPLVLFFTLLGGSGALAGAVTLCGALVSRAANRGALAGAVSVPLVLPVLGMGVAALRVVFAGEILNSPDSPFLRGFISSGTVWSGGLVCYAVISLALGPWIYAAVWKS